MTTVSVKKKKKNGEKNVLVKDRGNVPAGGQHSNLPSNRAAPGDVSVT